MAWRSRPPRAAGARGLDARSPGRVELRCLAGLPRRSLEASEPRAQPAFEARRDARVITKDLCRRLIATQKSRILFEHDYVRVAADDVQAAVVKLLGVAPEFLERFSGWIKPYLLTRSPEQAAE
jgi:hypothetical protein